MKPLNPISLPFWLSGAELSKLTSAAHTWFSKLGDAALWPATQLDARTASLEVLDLMAWQRNISRYSGEPERLYRLRVAYAYANARDAGSIAGWKRIFERLELGTLELEERVAGQDWDIIGVVVDDTTFPDSQNILELIINEYGRTCRRYRFISRIVHSVTVTACAFDNDHNTVLAKSHFVPVASVAVSIALFDNNHSTISVV